MIFVIIVAGIAVSYILTREYADTEFTHVLTARQRADAASHAAETAQIERNYVYPQKTEFVDKMRKELAEMQGVLTQFSAQIANGDGPVNVDEQKTLDAARENWSETERHLDLAERATETTWFALNRDFRKSYAALKVSIHETRRKLSGKSES